MKLMSCRAFLSFVTVALVCLTVGGIRADIGEVSLSKEELVKLRLGKLAKIDLPALASDLAATVVQTVGRTVVLYRAGAEPKIQFPS